MSEISIRLATTNDAEAIAEMLSHLAGEIGDTDRFSSTAQTIKQYGFGKNSAFHCLVAGQDKADSGLALFFPVFSTTRGKPGVYVQDLWIAPNTRGQGLGQLLLTETVKFTAAKWGATYLSLTVYADNIKARRFYQNMGFEMNESDLSLALSGEAFNQVRGEL